MTELLNAAQMHRLEEDVIGVGHDTGLSLMERAGQGVVAAIFAEWPALGAGPHHGVVLCGPGNNGGDGFVVARLLHGWGWRVDVYLAGDAEALPPDAKVNHARWCALGPVGRLRDAPAAGADLFVDALFGTGLSRPLQGGVRDWVAGTSGGRVVAVDLPSGLCSDSGRILGEGGAAVQAALTVTFHRAKLGHYLGDGPARCGKTVVADIGLREGCAEAVPLVKAPMPGLLAKTGMAHKFTHGHAVVLSGGAGRTGAARLAARAALRIGAGLVTLGVPPAAQMEVAGQITALMLTRLTDGEALAALLQDARITALCLGPGMGVAPAGAALGQVLGGGVEPRPTLIDADALSALAKDPALMGALHGQCILTPHMGEFARLFPDLAAQLDRPAASGPALSRLDAVRAAAARAGAIVLLKGVDTVIAVPDGRAVIHAAAYGRAAPWLATAGAGDVLAGFVTGLLARGIAPFKAAEAAVWLHVECARRFGPGLIAEDLPETLPAVLRDLGA